ncbi:MAG: hypothetical protein VX494_01995 [Actinomycetota bacterium]|nr:hypothetical protein [Actinomycetota bacterium]
MNEQQAFEEALRIQAVGAGTPTLTLDDVRGRARGIRRRRAAVASAAGAAVVAAAVVPIALLIGGDSSPDTLPPADNPTVSDTANPVPPPDSPSDPPLAAVDQRGAWMVDGEVVPANGDPFTPELTGEISSFVGLDDGRWVFTNYPEGGDYVIALTDGSGSVLETFEAADSGLAVDDEGAVASWLGTDSRLRVLLPGDDQPTVVPTELDGRVSAPTPLEVLPGCTAQECVVIVESYDRDGSTHQTVALDGSVASLDRLGLLSITDVSPDGALVSGHVSVDEFGQEYCSGVLLYATGEELWRTCESGSFRFSPDAALVLGLDPYLDGPNHSLQILFDATTGRELARHQTIIYDETWDSPDSWLSVEGGSSTSSVIRYTWDGSRLTPEVLDGPVETDAEVVPGTAFRLGR